MGAPPLTTHKPVWMYRDDEVHLNLLKGLLGVRDGKVASNPEAIGAALRIAVMELSRRGYPRQDGPGPRSWELGYVPPEGTTTIGPFTSSEAT